MIVTTATTSTITAMSLLPNQETHSMPTSFQESIDAPDTTMQSFTPGQCLFCPNPSPSFTNSVKHMQKAHGLFIPHQQHLAVDLETLFGYLHLIIFGYRECICCGTERATVQAVQQHMTGKGHCKFDISEQDSEFAEFYDFSEPEDDAYSDIEGAAADDERNPDEMTIISTRKPLLADEDSIRLPSGKLISRHSSAQAAFSVTQSRRRTRNSPSRLEYSVLEPNEEGFDKGEVDPSIRDTRLLSKREKREKATITYQLANMSASDRNALIHLPASQQRSILAVQHRNAEKVQKEEKRKQSKIDRKGNKNLYAYWNTETPVYQCG